MQLVVVALGQQEDRHRPPSAHREGAADERRLVHGLSGGGQLLELLELPVEPGEEEGAEHAEDPHEVIEARSEEPLVQRVGELGVQRVVEAQQEGRRAEDHMEHAGHLRGVCVQPDMRCGHEMWTCDVGMGCGHAGRVGGTATESAAFGWASRPVPQPPMGQAERLGSAS